MRGLCSWLAIGLILAAPAVAETAKPGKAEKKADCAAAPKPVVSLSYGSRYTKDSKTRSDFDAESNAEVEKVLKPIDKFIGALARESNDAMVAQEKSTIAGADPLEAKKAKAKAEAGAECVFERIATWAKAKALSDLDSETAKLSAASRMGGFAYAYANALTVATPEKPASEMIDGWLKAAAQTTMTYFDTEAPPRAARNNLRLWAAAEVGRIGLTTGDVQMQDWARQSVKEAICSALPDGALPLEMERGPLALHYQLHAVGALVVTAALLQRDSPVPDEDLFALCDNGLSRIVGFTLDAIEQPERVEAHANDKQRFESARPFELAWIPAYLSFRYDERLTKLATTVDILSNSKLGGDQRVLWPTPKAPEAEAPAAPLTMP